MKKAAIGIVLGLVAVIALLLAALPFVLPPLVRDLAEEKLAAFGFPARVLTDLSYGWNGGPELSGSLHLHLVNSPIEANATFGIGLGIWYARVRIPQTELTESDPTVRKLLSDHPLPKDTSNLTFRATLSLDAAVERTRRVPVPVWTAKAPLRVASASVLRDDKPFSLSGLSVVPAASGIADHRDLAPLYLRIASAELDGFSLTNVTASIRATEKALLVTQATAGVCGGTVSLYSLFLDPKTLNAGFTLFMDSIDAGGILSHVGGFRGEASGLLHGKLRLFLKEGGKHLRIRDTYLYSTPGETGKLKMADSAAITDNLALAGIDADTRRNVADALTDLDYSVLKLDLKRTDGDLATLGVRLAGTATRGKTTVPVNLNINFNGKLEQIFNTGLDLSDKLKGKKK